MQRDRDAQRVWRAQWCAAAQARASKRPRCDEAVRVVANGEDVVDNVEIAGAGGATPAPARDRPTLVELSNQ